MNRIIVTIRINQKKEYDLELPVHQKIKDLMQDISDSLEGLDPLSWFDPEKVSFMDKRTGRRLNPEEFFTGKMCMEWRYLGNTGIQIE